MKERETGESSRRKEGLRPWGKWGPFAGCGPRALVALGGKCGKAETEFPEVLPGRGTGVQGVRWERIYFYKIGII